MKEKAELASRARQRCGLDSCGQPAGAGHIRAHVLFHQPSRKGYRVISLQTGRLHGEEEGDKPRSRIVLAPKFLDLILMSYHHSLSTIPILQGGRGEEILSSRLCQAAQHLCLALGWVCPPQGDPAKLPTEIKPDCVFALSLLSLTLLTSSSLT